MTIGAIAVAQARAAAAHACAKGWPARSAAFGTEVRRGGDKVLVTLVFCVMAAEYLAN